MGGRGGNAGAGDVGEFEGVGDADGGLGELDFAEDGGEEMLDNNVAGLSRGGDGVVVFVDLEGAGGDSDEGGRFGLEDEGVGDLGGGAVGEFFGEGSGVGLVGDLSGGVEDAGRGDGEDAAGAVGAVEDIVAAGVEAVEVLDIGGRGVGEVEGVVEFEGALSNAGPTITPQTWEEMFGDLPDSRAKEPADEGDSPQIY
jgi:hypothetical protein